MKKKIYVDVLIFLLMPLEICTYCGQFEKSVYFLIYHRQNRFIYQITF